MNSVSRSGMRPNCCLNLERIERFASLLNYGSTCTWCPEPPDSPGDLLRHGDPACLGPGGHALASSGDGAGDVDHVRGKQTWSWVARITSYSEPSLTWILSCDTEHADTVHREGWVEATGFIKGSAGIFTAARDPDQGWVILALASDGGYSVVGTSDSRMDADADLLDRRSDS